MNHVLFRDTLLNMLLMLVVIVALILPHLNPPASSKQAEPPGNLIVHITWPEGNTDVDIWLMGPGEPVPVGYSNKGGRLWNLLRDDLGNATDATDLNYENAFTRGVIPGRYTINAHCYRCAALPVKVDLEISLNKDAGKAGAKAASRVILTTSLDLTQNGQERTAIDFVMDADGNIDPASMNSVFKPLRSAKK